MPKANKTVSMDRSKAIGYKRVAENFYEGAVVAAEFEYWNAAGVLIVHAAIAFGDALTIKFGGLKNRGDDHQSLVDLIEEIVEASDKRKKALNQLDKIIAEKNLVSYSGDTYKAKDSTKLKKHIDRFKPWAESLL